MLDRLRDRGFDVEARNHAAAILSVDFPEPLAELVAALAAVEIPLDEIIAGGGGEARSTQRLRRALAEAGWPKHEFVVQTVVDGVPREAVSHEIDHVRRSPAGVIALEIEWNNKDPFFDRDLENFQRLHAGGAISAGVVVTRGRSLQEGLRPAIEDRARALGVASFDDLAARYDLDPTRRQRAAVADRMERRGEDFPCAWSHVFMADKFGAATTHWEKLETRIARGVGNPCPLLLVGIPAAALA